MSLSCISHVKRNLNSEDNCTRPPAPPIASFMGSTWDRSGSMQDMNGSPGPALYDWIKDACDQARILDQDCYLSVTTFDDESERKLDNIHWKNIYISLNEAKSWTKPRGMTKLYDTAVADIKRLRRQADTYRENLPNAVKRLNPQIVVAWSLMTDGMDNQSQICNQSTLAEAVIEAREAGCHCYFLAANCDGQQRGVEYGFDQDNSLTFNADRECSDNAFRGISAQLRNATAGSAQTSIPKCLRQSSCPTPSINTFIQAPPNSVVNLSPPQRPSGPPPITRSMASAASALLGLRTPAVNLRTPAVNLRTPAVNLRTPAVNNNWT